MLNLILEKIIRDTISYHDNYTLPTSNRTINSTDVIYALSRQPKYISNGFGCN